MQTIRIIQEEIADKTLIFLFFIGTPLLALSLLRIIESGWLSLMWLHTILYILLCIITYFRHQIYYQTKVTFVLLFFILIGFGAMIHNQSISNGSVFFIIATMLFMIHNGRHQCFFLITFFSFLQFSYIFFTNQFSIHNTLEITAYLLLSYIVIDMIGYLKNNLNMLLEQTQQQASQIQEIIDVTKVGTWTWNVQTGETIFNERWAELIGYRLTELSPVSIQTWKDLAHPDDLKVAEQNLQIYFDGKIDFYQTDFRMKHKNGHWVWLHDRGQVTQWNQDGSPLWMSGTHTDVTEQKKNQEQIRLSASVFENSQEGILITDKDNLIVDVNPACLELTGYTRKELMGQNPKIFSAGKQSKEFYTQMWETLINDGHWQGEMWNRKKSGEVYSERISLDTVKNENEELQHYVAVFYDITHIKKYEEELKYIAYNDALTKLPNRLLLHDRMQLALSKAKRTQKLLAVCYLDLDGFKLVNDTYGHKTGDCILIEVAKRLQNSVRADDTIVRIGGDEFVILMQDIEVIGKLKQVLGRILAAISSDYPFIENNLVQKIDSISASIGVTLYPLDENEADLLLRHADQAMYQAKQQGKNRYSFFDPKENSVIKTR